MRSSPVSGFAIRARHASIAVVLALALARPARAEDVVGPAGAVVVPLECARYWTIPGGPASPAAWDAVLSFAACIQDASTYRITRESELAGLVDRLETSLAPSLQLYVEALERAPDRIKLRAVYHVGLAQVALLTRARCSITSPALRAPLEERLEPHARLAYILFLAVERATLDDPALASDAVARRMVRAAREQAAVLRGRWPELPDAREVLQTLRR